MALNTKILNARTIRRFMGLWPPYLGAGVRVVEAAEDGSRFVIAHRPNLLTRNAVGTAFGGTLMSMVDPFFMLASMLRLGDDFYVWDTAAEVKFCRPGRGRVTVTVELDDDTVELIRRRTAGGEKYLHWFTARAVDADGEVVAEHRRQVYYRLKKKARR